jgi:hypothetical protein
VTETGLGPHCSSLALVYRTHEAWSQVEASPNNSQLMTPGLESHDCMELYDITTLLSMRLINIIPNLVLNVNKINYYVSEIKEGSSLQISSCSMVTFQVSSCMKSPSAHMFVCICVCGAMPHHSLLLQLKSRCTPFSFISHI